MGTTTSPNMFMPVPGVGTEFGPAWALDVNACLSLLDSHDHSLGRGVQITPAGMNINTALTLNSNNLTDVGGIAFTALGSNPTTLQFLYVSPGVETPLTEDLWFNDGNGNQVQITNNGLVNATIASLPGESYAAGTFFWKQGAGSTTPANFDIGSITIRPNVAATTFGVRLQPPTGITSQYDIALPLLPASKSFLTITASGTMEATTPYPLTGADIANQTITATQIANQTITATQIANGTITTTQISPTAGITGGQIAPDTVTQDNLAVRSIALSAPSGGIAQSASSGTFTNATTSYTQKTTAQTATITIASPAVITVASTTGFFVGMPVKFTTTGALPTGITSGTFYYVSNVVSGTTFRISTAPGGADINTSGAQSGVHTATVITFSCTIVTSGSPVAIILIPDGTATAANIAGVTTANTNALSTCSFKATRNVTIDVATTDIVLSQVTATGLAGLVGSITVPPGSFYMIDAPAAGTYTYEVELKAGATGNSSAQINNCKIMVYEL